MESISLLKSIKIVWFGQKHQHQHQSTGASCSRDLPIFAQAASISASAAAPLCHRPLPVPSRQHLKQRALVLLYASHDITIVVVGVLYW